MTLEKDELISLIETTSKNLREIQGALRDYLIEASHMRMCEMLGRARVNLDNVMVKLRRIK